MNTCAIRHRSMRVQLLSQGFHLCEIIKTRFWTLLEVVNCIMLCKVDIWILSALKNCSLRSSHTSMAFSWKTMVCTMDSEMKLINQEQIRWLHLDSNQTDRELEWIHRQMQACSYQQWNTKIKLTNSITYYTSYLRKLS